MAKEAVCLEISTCSIILLFSSMAPVSIVTTSFASSSALVISI